MKQFGYRLDITTCNENVNILKPLQSETDFPEISGNSNDKYLNCRLAERYLIKEIQNRTVSFPRERGHLSKQINARVY